MEENLRKADEESRSKDSKISFLEEEMLKLKKSAEAAGETSRNELKQLSEELDRSKEQEKALRTELEVAKKDASSPGNEDGDKSSVSELEKYKNEASSAAKVNAELRKELEEVRIECGNLKASNTQVGTASKDGDSDKIKALKKDIEKAKATEKENEEKVKLLEERLALAAEKEKDLNAKISSLEDSRSTASVDEVRIGDQAFHLCVSYPWTPLSNVSNPQ